MYLVALKRRRPHRAPNATSKRGVPQVKHHLTLPRCRTAHSDEPTAQQRLGSPRIPNADQYSVGAPSPAPSHGLSKFGMQTATFTYR